MKKSGIVTDGAGNAKENGKALVADFAFTRPLREVAAVGSGCPPVPASRCRRLAGRTRQLGRAGWRRRPRGRPCLRFGRGRHFAFEPAGLWRLAGGTVTVVVVVVIVVVGVGLPALVDEAGPAGSATVVVGVPDAVVVVGALGSVGVLVEPRPDAAPGVVAVSAATAPVPTMNAAHHASVDVQPRRSARAIALRLMAPHPADVLLSPSSSWDRPSHLIVTPRSRSTPHLCPLGQALDLNVLLGRWRNRAADLDVAVGQLSTFPLR